MSELFPELSNAFDHLMGVLRGCVHVERGRPFGQPHVASFESDPIAKAVKRFAAEAHKLPWLWEEIVRRASFTPALELPDDWLKGDDGNKRLLPVLPLFGEPTPCELPDVLLKDDCKGCQFLIFAHDCSVVELERRYRRWTSAGMTPNPDAKQLNAIYMAAPNVMAWVKGNVPPARPPSGVKSVDDADAKAAQYAALLVSVKSLADGSLKGIQRRVTVLLVEAGGAKAIADIATDKGVGWLAPFKGSVDGYLKGVRPKLQPLGADVKPFDQELRLVLQEKPTRPRRSTKNAAPPKRRQSAASLPPKRR